MEWCGLNQGGRSSAQVYTVPIHSFIFYSDQDQENVPEFGRILPPQTRVRVDICDGHANDLALRNANADAAKSAHVEISRPKMGLRQGTVGAAFAVDTRRCEGHDIVHHGDAGHIRYRRMHTQRLSDDAI